MEVLMEELTLKFYRMLVYWRHCIFSHFIIKAFTLIWCTLCNLPSEIYWTTELS